MKLVFKYKHYDNMYSKGYTKICISYKEINEVSIVTEKKFLDEIFLSSYLKPKFSKIFFVRLLSIFQLL